MDKNEYKIKSDEIKALIAQGEYQQAAEIADSIDWRRVKSVMMLCTISDLYKINRRYEDSRDILLLAYDRYPGGRTIVYSLCELSIKIEDYVMAIEYYKEFVQVAPRDTGRYILQYKLYQAQDVSLEERIAVLEELKAKDYREKWAYELAYLYHRVGLATKCIEECDELILWFGEGKYVVKAMELKMLHQPLTSDQQSRYDSRFQPEPVYEDAEPYYEDSEPVYEDAEGQEYYPENAYAAETEEQGMVEEAQSAVQPVDVLHAPTIRIPTEEIEIQVKTMDVGRYNTINLQKELAEGLREVLEDEESQDAVTDPMTETDAGMSFGYQADMEEGEPYPDEMAEEQLETEVFFGATGEMGDVGLEGADLPLQEELTGEEIYTEEIPAQELFMEEEQPAYEGEFMEEEPPAYEGEFMEEEQPAYEGEFAEEEPPAYEGEFAEEEQPAYEGESMEEEQPADEGQAIEEEPCAKRNRAAEEKVSAAERGKPGKASAEGEALEEPEDQTAAIVMEQLRMQNLGIEPPKEMAGVLSMESDGQISLVVPESEQVEKQITGQMRIEDILAEWERMKRDNEEKRREAIHQKMLRQTGPMFTAFEESIRDGLLEKLEQGAEPEEIIAQAEEIADDGKDLTQEDAIEEIEEIEELEEPGESLGEAEREEDSEEEFFEEEPDGFFQEASGEELFEEEPAEEGLEEEFFGEEPEEEEASEKEFLEEEPVNEEPPEEDFQEAPPVRKGTKGKKPAGESIAGTEPQDEKSAPKEGAAEKGACREESQPTGEKPRLRALTREEKELFGAFIQNRSSKEKLISAIDSISMAPYTGNVVITGDEGMDTLTLAKNMIRDVQMTDSNFSGKIAKISGSSMNQRDIVKTLDGLANGALIIQKASGMNKNTVDTFYKALQQEKYGLVIIMEDTRKAMNKFLGVYTRLAECFNARMDMEALSNDALVAFGKKYAREKEYSIDELGILALHTRIAEQQTSDHAVTIKDVKGIMDEAIRHANRKSLGHFVDILLAKRYDEEDMIILRENDFIY